MRSRMKARECSLNRHFPIPASANAIDFDHLLAQAGQRISSNCLGHRQRAHEIAEVVGERMKLEADGVGGEGTA